MLPNTTNVISAVSRRQDGNMSLNYGDTVNSLNNRRKFLGSLGIDYQDLVCAKQVHGNNVKYAREEDKGLGALFYADAVAETDAFITDRKNLPLAVFTADCLPVFLYDPQTPSIGLAHAGWRSTQKNIVTKCIELMSHEFKSRPQDLRVAFGAFMGPCCYEVGKDFFDYFPHEIIERKGKQYLDLAQANKRQLLGAGVAESSIFDPLVCTICHNEEWFSYRKEGDSCGRMISVIMLK